MYDGVLQTGFWIVEPNVGGNSTQYAMRIKPENFTDFPVGVGIYSYAILKRVGLGNWMQDGTFDDPGTPECIFPDGSVRRSGLSGFSNFSIGTSQNVPLPLNLISFSAKRQGENARIRFRTGDEKGIVRFEIQRSYDGIQFNTIGTLDPKGTSGAEYLHLDPKPFLNHNEALFYRLKSMEEDESSHYSRTEVLYPDLIKQEPKLILSPNPVQNLISIHTEGFDIENSRIRVFDALAREINLKILEERKIDVSALPAGIYHLVITNREGQNISEIIQKQ